MRNQSSVCPLEKNTRQTGSIYNPNHQLDDTDYKNYSRKGTTTTATTTSITTTAAPNKQCKCSHPELSHESEGDKICRIIGCHCWGFTPLTVSKVV